MGDNDVVHLREHLRFTAIAPDDSFVGGRWMKVEVATGIDELKRQIQILHP